MVPPNKTAPKKANALNIKRTALYTGLIIVSVLIAIFCTTSTEINKDMRLENQYEKPADDNRSATRKGKRSQIGEEVYYKSSQCEIADEPKTNRWGNPAHWGHKKLRPAMVHKIDRSQLPLFEQVFLNRVDKTIAGLLVIEPGTDLIGEDVFDETFVKAFLKSIESPIIISKDDNDEAKALKRAVIETKIDLKARHDAGEDIATILTDIRRELRELGTYREELKKLIEEKSRNHNMNTDDMKDFVVAANIMLDERGARPIVMPEFYYRKLEIRNQKVKTHKGE